MPDEPQPCSTESSPDQIQKRDNDPKFQKLVETVGKLRKYLDFTPAFFESFPDNLPRKFPLKIGPNIIGYAVIDWAKIGGKLFHVMTLKPKPDDMSEDEYFELVKTYVESLSPKEQWDVLEPSFSAMWHMLENMPEKINDAIVHLAIEGRQKIVIEQQRKLGQSVPSPAKFADEIAKMERAKIKDRLPKIQPSKTKPAWQSEENLKRFAERVLGRQLLCQCMKNIYDRCDFLEEWSDDLKYDEQFTLLSKNIPKETIAWAIRQIGDDAITARDKEPVPLACEMARQELDLPFQDIQTLNGYYLEGAKLLRDDRRRQKALANPAISSQLSTGEVDSLDSPLSTSKTDDVDSE